MTNPDDRINMANDDDTQLRVKKIEGWIDEHSSLAVELYFDGELKINLAKIWLDCSFTGKDAYADLIDELYQKYDKEIFDWLSENPDEMR